jgi:DNA replication protein DnaC
MYQCSDCDAAVAAELAERDIRQKRERVEANLLRSGLPAAYMTGERRTGDLPGSTHAVLSSAQSLGAGLLGLFLHGNAGTYKTSVAASILASHIRGGEIGLYVSAQDLLSDIHASYNGSGATRADLVDRLVNVPSLVLDDLGKEKASEHAAGVLFEILDGRYRRQGNGRWMIVTSNYDMDALCNRFPDPESADPIRRRLAELTVVVAMGRKR